MNGQYATVRARRSKGRCGLLKRVTIVFFSVLWVRQFLFLSELPDESHHHHHHGLDSDPIAYHHPNAKTNAQGNISNKTISSGSDTTPLRNNHNITGLQHLQNVQFLPGKPQFCKRPPKVIRQIQVSEPTSSPRILCFIMTHSGYHSSRIRAIKQTWGPRCDKLIVASNQTDPLMSTITMKSPATYLGLWEKLNETMQYVWDNFHPEEMSATHSQASDVYDWVYKADDDTYVVMENLKAYLASVEVQKKHQAGDPLIFGRRYSSPRYRNLRRRTVYFNNTVNEDFGRRFYEKMNPNRPVIYNYGGPGYAMNWKYVQRFVEIMRGPDTIHGDPPEDQGHGVVMAYHDIMPQNTRDEKGRERFHPESPRFMYKMDDRHFRLWNDNHKATGGISIGDECCSEHSIAFHHIPSMQMKVLDDYFYKCRAP